MSEFESVDYFTDQSLIPVAIPDFDYLRDRRPVLPDCRGRRRDHRAPGSARGIPRPGHVLGERRRRPVRAAAFHPRGRRHQRSARGAPRFHPELAEHVVHVVDARDQHWRTRALLSSLLTPKRLRENGQDFMLSNSPTDSSTRSSRSAASSSCRFTRNRSRSAVIKLFGLPRPRITSNFSAAPSDQIAGRLDGERHSTRWRWLKQKFTDYITTRRETPRSDVPPSWRWRSTPTGRRRRSTKS